MSILSEKLKYYRLQNKMTLSQLAKLSGVGQSTINDIENDKAKNPRMDTIKRLAIALNIDFNEFFDKGYNIEQKDLENWDNNIHIKETSKKYDLSPKAEKDIQKSLTETLDMLQNSQDGLMFDGEPLDDLTRELLKQSLENSMRMAKKIAKEKFTPKKYK